MPAAEPSGERRITLYSVNEDLLALVDSLDLCDTDEQRAACDAEILAAMEAQVRKTDSFGRFLAHLESQAALAEKEIARLEARQSAFLRARDRLEAYAVRTMQALNLPRLEGETSSLSLRYNTPAVDIRDESIIPGAFKIVRQTVSCDKRAIKQAIDHGESVPGAGLKPPTISLVRR